MSSFKKLSKSDVSLAPYSANKQWTLPFNSFPTASEYLAIYTGTNLTGNFSSGSDPISQGEYERLIYTQINQLFYQTYTASLDTSSLANSIYYESASLQRPTSSYFIYNDNPLFVDYFPTGINETIKVIAVNQNIYGSKIEPTSFILSSSAYFIRDDGYGNLYDTIYSIEGYISASYVSASYFPISEELAFGVYVGNVFYAHGLAVITNQNYQNIFPSP